MKIEQIRYILAVYEAGSISKAAQKFYMSRPNLSNAIRSLENEIGFEILERGTSGVKFTEKGLALIKNCQNIVKEVEEIQNLAAGKREFRFGIVHPNSSQAENAFVKLCRMVADPASGASQYRLSIYREYQYESMKMLNQHRADIAITISADIQTPAMTKELADRGLEYRKLMDVAVTVSMAKTHPLAKDPEFSFEKLRNYPCVNYAFDKDRGNPYNRIKEVSFMDLSKNIRVDSGFMKSKVISETNAYGIGIDMPKDWTEAHNRYMIPIPGLFMELGYIRRAGEAVSEPERMFIDLLMEEMTFLDEEKQ